VETPPSDDHHRLAIIPGMEASFTLTPFTESDHSAEPSFNDPFFSTDRYKLFVERLFQLSEQHQVELKDLTQTIGLWRGDHEPSVTVNAYGSFEAITRVGQVILEEFNQDAVRVVTFTSTGQHVRYMFNTGNHEPSTVISQLVELGVMSGHLTQNEIRLDEIVELPENQVAALMKLYGPVRIIPCQVRRIIR
jgi:hypothetical protein